MMKYKIGDRVLLKTWEEMEKEFGLNNECSIDCKQYFTEDMKCFAGDTVTISDISYDYDYYEIEEDDGEFNYSDDMIKCLASETATKTNLDLFLEKHGYEIVDCDLCKAVYECGCKYKCKTFKEVVEYLKAVQKYTLSDWEQYILTTVHDDSLKFNEFYILNDLHDLGYYQSITDTSVTVKEILQNCEAIGNG